MMGVLPRKTHAPLAEPVPQHPTLPATFPLHTPSLSGVDLPEKGLLAQDAWALHR